MKVVVHVMDFILFYHILIPETSLPTESIDTGSD